ncbi:MerR family transcriptional regulator [Paenibacillus sp. YN15]|uniref:MerR family transcriptional regulator n=1 Tax=Paenibacillus sp. YN15 TaxID=1742774 RepID=UPI000DCDDAB8|nr:MerR family transcriptional regulator [Paenibacillus sp. YN15]RAV03561.1 MerR family transcriptional regulator [Paenibacillus sp. YN15]
MEELVKIREVALKYDITARTLRYYEDMGLIESVRSEDYAYRMYDEKALKRLEQILVLRKLNISVKDICRIFSSPSTEVVLEVLERKVAGIDGEMALLQELKEIVLEFIRLIEAPHFPDAGDVRLLFEKAKGVERQLAAASGRETGPETEAVNRMLEVTEKLEKLPDIRVIEIPPVLMARSGEADLDAFDHWFSSVDTRHYLAPRDFLWFNARTNRFEWLFALTHGMEDTGGFEVFSFPGGLYAVASAIDGDEIPKVNAMIRKWVEQNEYFEVSTPANDPHERYDMGHIFTPKVFKEQTGYHLMDLFVPIVLRKSSRS